MTRRLVLSYVLITAFVLAVLVIPLGQTFARSERDGLLAEVVRDTAVAVSFVEEDLEEDQGLFAAQRLIDYATDAGARVVVTDIDGISVLDTDAVDAPPRDFSTRPEFVAALRGERAEGIRHSETLDLDLVYVAMPAASHDEVHGAVRITLPTSAADARARSVWLRLGVLSVVVLALVAIVGFALARSVTRPVRALRRATEQLAAGELDARVEADGPPEIRALAASFNQTAARLQTLIDAQDHFVSDASHQLRTPLTALRLRLEMLEAAVAADASADLTAAVAQVDRMAHMVDALLTLARAGAGRVSSASIDICDLLQGRIEVWGPVAADQGISVTVEAVPPIRATAIPGAVEEIVDNLIDNALGVSDAGQTVHLSADAGPDTVRIHVVDEGPGMTVAERERALDRFWRGSESDRQGTGIGLAIVDRLAKACDGSVRLHDATAGGLHVEVTLPRP